MRVAERVAGPARDGNGARHARAADARAHARHVARVLVLGVEQLRVVRVEPVDHRRLLAGNEIDAGVAVKGLGQHLARARDQRHERPADEAEGVKERQVHEDHVVDRDAHAIRHVRRVADDAMVVHGALGEAGGARRVEDEGAFSGIDCAGALVKRVVAHAPAVLHHLAPADRIGVGSIGHREHVTKRGEAGVWPSAQTGRDLAHHAEVVHRTRAVGEDHRDRVRLTEDVCHVVGAKTGVHRNEHGTDLHDREHRVEPLGAVDHPERDPVPRRDPELEEPLRGGVDAGVELGKGPALSLEGERLSRSPAPSRALGQEPDRLLVVPVPHDPLPDRSGRMGGVYSRPTGSARAGSRRPCRPARGRATRATRPVPRARKIG